MGTARADRKDFIAPPREHDGGVADIRQHVSVREIGDRNSQCQVGPAGFVCSAPIDISIFRQDCPGRSIRGNPVWPVKAARTTSWTPGRSRAGADICVQTESLARTYERPALRKLFAAFPADSKVAAASFAVIATVVSISDNCRPQQQPVSRRLPASHQGIRQWPSNHGGESQVPPDETTSYTLKSLANGFLTIFRLSQHALTASAVKRPREM